MSGIGGLGGVLAKLPVMVLPSVNAARPGDICLRLGDIADRYGVRRALSGVLCGSVDMVTGSKICPPAREADFALRGRLPLEWSRCYSSAVRTAGVLGAGWRTGWEITLRQAGGQLTYADEYGRLLTVPLPEPGSQVIVLSEQLHIACLPDGRMVVADRTPRYRVFGEFDPNGVARLKYIEDLHKQRIGCIWDAEGRLLRMRGTCGHELRMHYDPVTGTRLGAIECVAGGPTGMLAEYGYNENGELAEVRNRLGETVRRFAYRDGRIVEEAGPLGMAARYVWQTVDGVARVIERFTSEGARERCSYSAENRSSQATDVFGNSAYWQCDAQGHVVAFSDFDGRRYTFDYDETGAPNTLGLPNGGVVRLTYDSLGRVVQEIDPMGQTSTTVYAFASRQPVVVTRSDKRTWTWHRNEALDPIKRQAPWGEATNVEYGEDGLPSRCTDAGGAVTTLEHNARGQVTRRIDADGNATQYDYDINGNIAAVADPSGAVTRIECDALGHPLTVTRPDGRHERHVWNAAGQRTSFVGASGQSRHWHRDRRGNVVRAVDEEGHLTAYRYDAHGRPIRIESANGAVRTLEWGAMGCVSITDADGVIRAFNYTESAQIRRTTTRAGPHERHETFAYDVMGRLARRDTQHNHYVYRYSARGKLEQINRTPTKEGERLGMTSDEIRFEYDPGDRLIAEHGINGELRYAYDDSGALAAVTLPQGQVVRMRRYDNGTVGLIEIRERPIAQFWYDAMRRETVRTQGALHTNTGYTELGWPAWWRSASALDDSGRGKPTGDDMQLWRDVSYSASDVVVQTNGPASGQTYYDYDKRGCLLRRVSDQLGIEYFTWDAACNLLDPPAGNGFPAVYSNHRIKECRGSRYEYDAWGQVVRKSGRDHALSLDWDAEGRVIAVRRKGRTIRYRYDALGRRIEKRVEASPANGPLTRTGADSTRYVWQGNRLLQELRSGTVRTYLYRPTAGDSLGYAPLACMDQSRPESGELNDTRVYHYHVDPAGTAVALTDDAGKLVWRGRYQAWGTLFAQEWGGGKQVYQPLRFAGQSIDEETALHYNGRRFYDPDAGRYISPDRMSPGGVSPYRYAPNPLTWSNPLGGATPVRFADVGANASGFDCLLDPSQQVAGIIEEIDSEAGWNFL
ncbi:RHS repeat-associated core domain-containing protein [Trinickia mobilis]|uniref:RHS repeat-associated core domain-containing protein n=1 Tax=Trinickia mobilis TaxID=2816356 RepID=UPI00286830DC|nr:RHS repeat-associated core domain-containing protein [Trinickia mobilis]